MPHHGFIPSSAEEILRRRVKIELRKRIRGLRNTMPASACAERSARICAALEKLEVVQRAGAAALFWPMLSRHEVDLRALDAAMRARGARIAYPSIDDAGAMTFRFAETTEHLEDRGKGFHEPPADAPEAGPGELAVVVVPAIALDPRGHRIGYGAGFYDRTLPRFVPAARTIGVAYDFQLVAEVPETEGDVPMDVVVTDARVIEVTGSAASAP